MKVLLDTHALLWVAMSSASLSETAMHLLRDDTNQFFVSAASAWEIATKVRLGKLREAERLELRFQEEVENAGYILLSIDTASALRAGRFPAAHRDPFDRMIAAQAIGGDLMVLSNDAKLDLFGVRRLW